MALGRLGLLLLPLPWVHLHLDGRTAQCDERCRRLCPSSRQSRPRSPSGAKEAPPRVPNLLPWE
eukprot:10900613-Prorocentrum_lima.AAC.1